MPESQNIPPIDITGVVSAIFIVVAVSIGVLSLFIRKNKFSIFGFRVILALVLARFGMVFWVLSRGSERIMQGYALPIIETLDQVNSIISRAGTVLLGSAIAVLLISIAVLITDEPKK